MLWAVTAIDTVVIVLDWSVETVALDIVALVISPLSSMLTFDPLLVEAAMIIEFGIGVGEGLDVGLELAVVFGEALG